MSNNNSLLSYDTIHERAFSPNLTIQASTTLQNNYEPNINYSSGIEAKTCKRFTGSNRTQSSKKETARLAQRHSKIELKPSLVQLGDGKLLSGSTNNKAVISDYNTVDIDHNTKAKISDLNIKRQQSYVKREVIR